MMAHQCGVPQVVATMGTALNARHVRQLSRFVKKVVLVFDSDTAGDKAWHRGMEELLLAHDVEVAVARLPQGLDPCDLLVEPDGVETFKKALLQAKDALDFRLDWLLEKNPAPNVETTRRIVDDILSTLSIADHAPKRADAGEARTDRHATLAPAGTSAGDGLGAIVRVAQGTSFKTAGDRAGALPGIGSVRGQARGGIGRTIGRTGPEGWAGSCGGEATSRDSAGRPRARSEGGGRDGAGRIDPLRPAPDSLGALSQPGGRSGAGPRLASRATARPPGPLRRRDQTPARRPGDAGTRTVARPVV